MLNCSVVKWTSMNEQVVLRKISQRLIMCCLLTREVKGWRLGTSVFANKALQLSPLAKYCLDFFHPEVST